MSQSPAVTLSSTPPQAPHPMRNKIIVALVVVVIGHVVVLWGLSHIKTPELVLTKKTPLNVRFVKIQAPPALPPKPKAEPKKEQPQPKKEVKQVKIVPKAAPPKKVERVQQVKKAEAPKEVEQATPKVMTSTSISEHVNVTAKPTPQPVAVQPPQRDTSPKQVSIGGSGVQWSRTPRPTYTNSDLQGQTRTIIVRIDADERGKIINVRIVRSSGVSSLDDKILRAVRNAKFKPYKENGEAYPIQAEQPFELKLNPNG